jgi:uncharacterized protein YndB with AHSA1/START domain
MTTAQQVKEITFEVDLPHQAPAVWTALTSAKLIERWLMPNDFAPIVGHKFQFRRAPMGDWNGVVDCEVLEVEVDRRLVCSWKGGFGTVGELDTRVIWTLTPIESGTRLTMVHSGFRLPRNEIAFAAMAPGWGRIKDRIAQILSDEGAADPDKALR